MKVIQEPAELENDGRPVSVAIGMFDGVHLGHQQVIQKAVLTARKSAGRSAVVTFDRHPSSVVAPERAPRLIYSLAHKLRVLEGQGADVIWLIRFDEAFSRKPAERFVDEMLAGFGTVRSVCVGSGFTFGWRRQGDVRLLEALGGRFGFEVQGIPAVALEDEAVSSTRIRERVETGRLEAAGRLLGRPYSVAGRVERGDQLGRRLGFPTANLSVSGLVTPPRGVYAASAILDDGVPRDAVVNLGVRPTLETKSGLPRVEAHLLDFDGDLYGAELEIVLIKKLRPEMRFDSPESLRLQIQADAAEARAAHRERRRT